MRLGRGGKDGRRGIKQGGHDTGLQLLAASHQIAVDQEHGEIHQNPRGQHEDDGVEAQDIEKPQVVDSCVSQHLDTEEKMQIKKDRNGTELVVVQSHE